MKKVTLIEHIVREFPNEHALDMFLGVTEISRNIPANVFRVLSRDGKASHEIWSGNKEDRKTRITWTVEYKR